MNVLYTEIVTDSMGASIFWGVVSGIFTISFFILAILEIVYDHKVVMGICLILLSLVAGLFSYISFIATPTTHKYIECIFVPGYSIPVEEYENYKFIEKRGEIYKFEFIEDKN